MALFPMNIGSGGGTLQYLGNYGFTRHNGDGNARYVTLDLSQIYPDYANLTVNNIFALLTWTSVGNITTGGSTITYSYDASTGIYTINSSFGIWATGSQTKFDVYIVK